MTLQAAVIELQKLWSNTYFSYCRIGEPLTLHSQRSPISVANILIADLLSNLPTGGFISSSGLESHISHGYLLSDLHSTKSEGLMDFITCSIHSYARLMLPFLAAVWRVVSSTHDSGYSDEAVRKKVAKVIAIDQALHSTILNTPTRRSSTAQGCALLTLYERAFSDWSDEERAEGGGDIKGAEAAEDEDRSAARGKEMRILVSKLRDSVRQEHLNGHLVIGFGVLTAALGLSLRESE